MEKRNLRPYLNIIAALAVTVLLLAFTTKVYVSNEAGVIPVLPDKVGEWVGDDLRFCQNPACQKEFMASELENLDVCPECGGELGPMSLIERQVLPNDTVLMKKKYTNPDGQVVFASMVLSGADRASIHRPELCMTGQGNEIVDTEVIDVDMDDADSLGVKILKMELTIGGGESAGYKIPRYYAYWFVGNGRETPYHWQRMYWMASDMIFKNVAHRWAYLSVSGMRGREGDESYKEQIKSFVHDFYPQVKKKSSEDA
jgi:hypothetical protein